MPRFGFALHPAARLALAVLAGLTGLSATPVAAQFDQDQVSIKLVWQQSPVAPDSTASLGVVIDIVPGWHIQAGENSGDEAGSTFPSSITPTLPDGWKVTRVLWPEAHDFVVGEGAFALRAAGYEGRTITVVDVDIPATASPGDYPVSVELGYQTCDDTQCLPPATVRAEATIGVSKQPINALPLNDDLAKLFEATYQANDAGSEDAPSAPSVEFVEGGRIRAALVWHRTPVAGSVGYLGVIMDVESGWHIQAGLGSPEQSDETIPTSIALSLPTGWKAGSTIWPHAEEYTIGEGAFALTGKGYVDSAMAVIPIEIPQSSALGMQSITAVVTYQACDDTSCEPPVDVELETAVEVVASRAESMKLTSDTYFARFESMLADAGIDPIEATLPPSQPNAIDNSDEVIASNGDAEQDAVASADVSRPRFFGLEIPRPDGAAGFLVLALLGAIGGFVLNLTPCVLPVIPIKIMTISQHAGTPGKSLMLGVWMALGVVAFWVGIGLPVAFISSVTDPSRIFGFWWVTLGIGVLIGAMGIGIMGLFSIRLPQSVYAVNPKADTPVGSFLFGVMTAVLGLPCFGFVAGALLAGAATLPPATVMVIFASLGVGMAAPYLVLAAKPSLVERIPRTGPASELVKQVMGLLLLAAAAYFVGSGLIGLVSENPYLGKELHWWAIAVFATMAGLWLIFRTFQITKRGIPRAVFTVMGLIFALAAVLYANDSTGKARSNWEAIQTARANSNEGAIYYAGLWNDYTPSAFNQARADGKIVVLDFTATWCLNCKALKAAVLNRDPVKTELNRDDVVSFTVDLTSTKAPGWEMLRDLGQVGIPLLVIYTPHDETPWQSNAYTSRQVLDALSDARAEEVAHK